MSDIHKKKKIELTSTVIIIVLGAKVSEEQNQ